MKEESVRKMKEGIVVSNKMQRTVTVNVSRMIKHPLFGKRVLRGKKYYADCADKKIEVGAKVRIVETKPLSKLKRWRVVETLAN